MSEHEEKTEKKEMDAEIPVTQESKEGETKPVVTGQLLVALSILIVIFGASYIPALERAVSKKEVTAAPEASLNFSEAVEEGSESAFDPFEDVSITADAAYVWDMKTERALYAKNEDKALPLASVSKLMTALVVHELLDTGADIDITLDAVLQEGDGGLRDGESFTVEDLTDLTLINSSNDGAYALAETAGRSAVPGEHGVVTFVNAMNVRAEDLGLTQTYFKNPTGLDISLSGAGAYGSARDMAFLMEHIITQYPEIVEYTKEQGGLIMNEAGESHVAENTNYVVHDIPGIIASKTGYTDLSGGNLVIAFDAGLNRPIVIAVLGSSRAGRFTDVLTLVEAARTRVAEE